MLKVRRKADSGVRKRSFGTSLKPWLRLAWTAPPDGAADFANGHWLEYMGLFSQKTAGLCRMERQSPQIVRGFCRYRRCKSADLERVRANSVIRAGYSLTPEQINGHAPSYQVVVEGKQLDLSPGYAACCPER